MEIDTQIYTYTHINNLYIERYMDRYGERKREINR